MLKSVTRSIAVLFFISGYLFFPAHSHGQFALSGKVYQEDGNVLEHVNVSLLLLPDSLPVLSQKTDENGNYVFRVNKAGEYMLRYTGLGYGAQSSRSFLLKDVDKINMNPVFLRTNNIEIEAVSVVGKQPALRQYADKMVIDVEGSVIAEGNNLLELLEKAPGVISDGKGNFSIQGRNGANVKIDGRDAYVSGNQLASLLRSMQANEVAKLELMSSPTSKEDAAGTAGIINIITKRNKRGGFGGDVFVRGSQSRRQQGSMGGGVHFKTEKLNIFANASVGYEESKERVSIERKFYSQGVLQSTQFQDEHRMLNPGRYHSFRTGATFEFDTTSVLEASVNWIKGTFLTIAEMEMDIYKMNGKIHQRTTTVNRFNEGYNNMTYNMNFVKRYSNEEHFLKVNVDFAPHKNDYDNVFRTNFLIANGDTESIKAISNIQALSNTTYSARLDYSKPYDERGKLELGWKSTHFFIDNQMDNDTLNNEKWIRDLQTSNRFQYTQHVQAAYVIYAGKFNKFEYQAGLRGEYTFIKANQKTLQKVDRSNYFDLFPNALALYHLNERNFLRASFNSRIERPGDHDINVFRVYEDAFSYFEGNPGLKPEKSYIVEFGHGFRNKLFTTISLSQGRDVITWVSRASDVTLLSFSRPENIGRFANYSVSMMYNNQFAPWWSGSHYINGFHNAYTGTIEKINLDSKGSSWSANSRHTLQFKWGFRAEMLGYFNSGVTTGVRRSKETYGVDLALEKKLLGERAMIKLAATGLVRNANPQFTSTFEDLVLFQSALPDNRKVLLSFSYRFGV